MKRKKSSKKRKKHLYESDTGVDLKKDSNILPNVVDNEAETSSFLLNKRAKITNEAIESKPMMIWGCHNRQLDERQEISLGTLPCVNLLIEQMCTKFNQTINETVLVILCDDGTWSQICIDDVNLALIDIGIKECSIISIDQKPKLYLTVRYIPLNHDIKIEFNGNDTIRTLKEKILFEFQLDFDIEHLQLNIDSLSDDQTLSSLNISPTSLITIKIRPIKGNGRCGLRNLGNTCFMNSALQCLSNIESLTDYFLTHEIDQGDVAQDYYGLIKNIWSENKTLFVPHAIKKSLSRYVPVFADYEQQDAHEFMIFLLNQLHQELQQTTSIISELFHFQINGITTCLTCRNVRSTPNLTSFIPLSLDNDKKKRVFKIIFESAQSMNFSLTTNASGCIEDLVDLFINEVENQRSILKEGLFERLKVISTRTNEEFSFETLLNNFLDSELKFINHQEVLREAKTKSKLKKSSLELIDCLNEFTALETPKNLWFCKSTCKQPVHTAKQMLLSDLPPVLIIQLKRFTEKNGCMRKLDTMVNFPRDGLDLSRFVINQQDKTLYDLIAVINHMGNINRGHYTAYVRQSTITSKEWLCFNDELVTSIDESDVVSNSAYILIYNRRNQSETAF